MKHLVKFAYCLLFSLLAVACKQADAESDVMEMPSLTLYSEENMVAEATQGSVYIRFVASADWTVTVPTEAMGWCMPAAYNGSPGERELEVVLARNDQDRERNARITISCGKESLSVFIVQKQENSLTVSADRFEVKPEGGIIAIEVKANVDYAWEMEYGMSDWVAQVDEAEAQRRGVQTRYAVTRALTTETLYFRVQPNDRDLIRTGSIVFYAPDKTGPDGLPLEEVVNIYQHEKSILLLEESEASISDRGGQLWVDISSNVDFDVQLPAEGWIQRDASTRIASSHTLCFTVQPNDTYDVREADIVFYQKDNPDLADTLHVVQAQNEAVILGSDVLEVAQEGGVVEVLVKSNVDVELYIFDGYADWLKQVDTKLQTRALTENRFYLEVAPNPYYDERKGSVLVRGNGESYHQQELKIVQGQRRHLEMNSDTLVVEPEGEELYLSFRTSVDYEVELTADWLHLPQTRGLDSRGISVTVDPYTDVNQPLRQALVIVKDTKSALADTTVIRQKPLLHGVYNVDPAGTLPDLVPEDQKLEMRALKVSGKINGTDIHLIREMSGGGDNGRRTGGKVTSLDLSGAEIVGGGEAYYGRWGSGAVIPTPGTYWYTCDSGMYTDRPNGWTENYYSEGVGAYMFYLCKLTTLILPDNIRRIGESSFRSCKIERLTLPATVTTIGKEAFVYSSLQVLHVKAQVPPQLEADALKVDGTLTVYVPSEAVDDYKTAEGWKDLTIMSESALD